MMNGPLNRTEIIDRRVRSRLDYIRHYAPQYYKHIVDEEVRRRGGGPQTWRYRIANYLGFGLFRREWAEREVARDFFTYEHVRGRNYLGMLRDLNWQIQAIGAIGGGAFVDSRGNAINMGAANPVNEFDVAVGPNGVPTHETVVVRWNTDDFITIKKKLERANVWANFSRQAGARELIHLKFRHSELKRVIHEEEAKVSADRFNPQRLKTWLDNEAMTLALRDEAFTNWVNANIIPLGFGSIEALSTGNPNMYQQLLEQQKQAKERVRNNTMEQMLQDILTPKQLENVHTSLEAKAMLAYLEAGIDDAEEGPALREFVRSISGRGNRLDQLKEREAEWKNNLTAISDVLTSFGTKYNELISENETITRITAALTAISGRPPTPEISARIEKYNVDIQKAQQKAGEIQREIINNVWNLKEFIRKYQGTTPYNAQIANILAVTGTGGLNILTNPMLTNKPSQPTEINLFLDEFNNYYSDFNVQNALDELRKMAQSTKADVDNELKAAQQSQGKTEKMDSRGLLYKLIERDLKLKGVTEETGLPQKALYATNMIITKTRHLEIYGATNKRIVDQSSPLVQRMRNIAGTILPSDWLPILSAKDVLEHVVDTDPDLALFHDITVFSTRSDFIKAMQRMGKVSPQKLREMQMKLAEFIKGIEVPTDKGLINKLRKVGRKTIDLTKLENLIAPMGKRIVPGKTYTVRAEEAPMIENMIHILSLLESQIQTENFLKEVEDDETINPDTDRAKLVLKKLETDTESSVQMDNAIKNGVQAHHALYKRQLLFSEQNKTFNEAVDQLPGNLSKLEKREELERLGANARRRSLSIRMLRAAKTGGKGFLKYGPHTWPFWAMAGVGYGGYKAFKTYMKLFKGETYDKAKEAEKMDWKAFAKLPGNVVGSVWGLARSILTWPAREIDTKVQSSIEKSYAKRAA